MVDVGSIVHCRFKIRFNNTILDLRKIAKQNGITAIVLALNLETMVSGAIATIALAILVVRAPVAEPSP